MAQLTGNATLDGVDFLDRLEGEGTADRWCLLCAAQGGCVLCSPWAFVLAYPEEDDPRCLYVAFLYGEAATAAAFARALVATKRFDRISFARNLTRSGERVRRYDLRRFLRCFPNK